MNEQKKHGEELAREAHEEIEHAKEALNHAKEIFGDHQPQVFIPDQAVIDRGAHHYHRKHKQK